MAEFVDPWEKQTAFVDPAQKNKEDEFVDPANQPTFMQKVLDLPVQVAGGVERAVKQNIATMDELYAAAYKHIPQLRGTFINEEDMYKPAKEYIPRPVLPSIVPEPKSIAGQFVRGTSQFLTNFLPASSAMKGMGIANAVVRGLSSGAIADFAAFDPHEKRLSNLVQSVPALQNPVTEYLQAKEDDPAIEGRIKQTLEGAGLGLLVNGVIKGVKMLRGARQAKTALTEGGEQAAKSIVKKSGQAAKIILDTDVGKAQRAGKIAGPGVGPEDLLREPIETKLAGTDIAPTLAHMNTEKGVKTVLANTVKAIEPQIQAARRGRVSWSQVEDVAGKLAADPKELMSRRVGQAFNAEQLEGMKLVMHKVSTELHAAAKRAYGGTDADKLAFASLRDNYFNVMNNFMGVRAEAGRALNILKKGTPSARQMKDMIESMGGHTSLEDQARLIAELDTPEQIAKAVALQAKSKISDVLMETWINSLLSGPQTHFVNMTSNTLVSLWRMPEHMLAATFGKLHGGEKVYYREGMAHLYGYGQGVKEGVRTGLKTLLTEAPSDLMSKIEVPRHQAISATGLRLTGIAGKSADVLGKFTRMPGRALMAEDEFFKAINYRMSLNAGAMRNGIRQGLNGRDLASFIRRSLENPDDILRSAALDDARYYTFTKPLGKTGIAVQQFANSHPAAKVIMPFIRTPSNIVKFAGERSPFALFSKAVRDEIAKGGIARDQALAKITMGSTIGSAVAMYAAEGKITGGGPVDPASRQALYRTGWQPYSLKIGQQTVDEKYLKEHPFYEGKMGDTVDKYYAYGRLEPIAMIFGVSADMAEIAGQIEEVDAAKVATMIGASVSKNMVSKTWLQGLSSALEAIEDPDRYFETFVRNLAGTVVPTIVAQYARANDPVLRETRTILDRIKSRIPGYREGLAPRLNLWGEPIVLEGGLGPDMVSPIYQSTHKAGKVDNEIVRLKLAPAMPKKKLAGVELSKEQYNEYVKLAGEPAKRILDNLVNNPAWDRIPDFEKGRLIKNIIDQSRETGGELMRARYPDMLIREPLKKQLQQIRR